MKFIHKPITVFLFFFLVSTGVFTQTSKIDSLKIELQNHKEKDTTRVNLLNALAFLNFSEDMPKALEYLEEADTIAEAIDFTKGKAKSLHVKGVLEAFKSNYRQGFQNYTESIKLYESIEWKEGIAECYKYMGVFRYRNGNQKEAIEYYEKSLEILEESGKKKEIALILYEIGWSYLVIGNYNDARSHFLKALKINEEIGNHEEMSVCNNGIAITYSDQGNSYVALDYFNRALTIAKKSSNVKRTVTTLGNMGTLYLSLKKYDRAIELFNEAEKLSEKTDTEIAPAIYNNLGFAYKEKNNNELAYEYFKKSQKLYIQINSKHGEAIAINNIGDIYLETKDYTKAYEYFKEAKEICSEIEFQRGLCYSYLGLAKVYTQLQNYDKALNNALKSNELSVKHVFYEYQSQVQEVLSTIYNNTRNYKKAFESHQQFKKLNDSLFNKENIEKIAQLENEYKYKQALDSASIRELKLTRTVNTTSQDLEKSQRNLLLGVIVFLGMTMILGGIIFFLKFRNVKTKTQNIIIEQKLLRSQMTPHFIFNSLSVLQGMILNKEEKQSISYLSRFSKLLRTVLENSRYKTVSLSEELSAIDSYMMLQNLDVDPPFNYQLTVDDEIDKAKLKIPPMLIQPFIENAIEHAFPNKRENKEIKVSLTFNDQKLVCTIEDNGVGYNPDKANSKKEKQSLATTITSERLAMLSKDFKTEGSVTIENKEVYDKQGTLITLVIPYKIETV